jgi:hypothetical protein
MKWYRPRLSRHGSNLYRYVIFCILLPGWLFIGPRQSHWSHCALPGNLYIVAPTTTLIVYPYFFLYYLMKLIPVHGYAGTRTIIPVIPGNLL